LVNDQKSGVEISIFPANEEQEPANLTNNQQENLDKRYADNVIMIKQWWGGGFTLTGRNIKKDLFPKKGYLKIKKPSTALT
jgi:hypothetical protein